MITAVITAVDILTLLSIVIGLLTFAIGYVNQREAERRQRTFEFIQNIVKEGTAANRSNLIFSGWLRDGKVFEGDDVEADLDEIIIALLDQYDLIADVSMKGVIDRKMIARHLGGRMKSSFKALSAYISARRERLERPALYASLERFVDEEIDLSTV